MRNILRLALMMVILNGSSAFAQQYQTGPRQGSNPNPMIGVLQRWWAIADYIVRAAEVMPEDNYAFKPFADVRSFADEIGHVADDHYLRCSALRSVARPATTIEGHVKAKESLVSRLKESVAYCDAVYRTMTDADLGKSWQQGSTRGINLGPLVANIAHDNEHAGIIIMLMRMSGIKPPPFD